MCERKGVVFAAVVVCVVVVLLDLGKTGLVLLALTVLAGPVPTTTLPRMGRRA